MQQIRSVCQNTNKCTPSFTENALIKKQKSQLSSVFPDIADPHWDALLFLLQRATSSSTRCLLIWGPHFEQHWNRRNGYPNDVFQRKMS